MSNKNTNIGVITEAAYPQFSDNLSYKPIKEKDTKSNSTSDKKKNNKPTK